MTIAKFGCACAAVHTDRGGPTPRATQAMALVVAQEHVVSPLVLDKNNRHSPPSKTQQVHNPHASAYTLPCLVASVGVTTTIRDQLPGAPRLPYARSPRRLLTLVHRRLSLVIRSFSAPLCASELRASERDERAPRATVRWRRRAIWRNIVLSWSVREIMACCKCSMSRLRCTCCIGMYCLSLCDRNYSP